MGASVKTAIGLLTSIWMLSATAQTPPSAYQLAARSAAVPAVVLYAMAQQESGIRLRGQTIPWPWTLNIAGGPYYYPNRAQACSALKAALQKNLTTRIDVGLAQLNLGYQQRHYRRPCELLDPYRNLAIAAAILRDNHRPGENWLTAAGRYHRPAGGELATRYRNRISLHLAKLIGEGKTPP